MKTNRNVNKIILISLFVLAVLATMGYTSYYYSKMNAEALIGKSTDHLQLSNTIIEISPFRKKTIWWRFTFSTPGVYDDKLNIYTSLFGSVTETTPKDLESRLRQAESEKQVLQ